MSYQALARKWRPKRFADVVGQAHVIAALSNALDSERVHHAFLFAGTRGIGKTTLARIFAKALNCEEGMSSEPCGECSSCRHVSEGSFIDLIEVDAASRTRVDDTRELLDNVQYAPSVGRFKIYLIDEVHMLSGHSFNALLKTLEEPPDHVKFLLATTNPQKLPVTVLSRCLQFNLKALQPEEISDRLEAILVEEGIQFEVGAIELLARAADGSLRDGLSLLDQAIAHGNLELAQNTVREMLGLAQSDYIEKLLLHVGRQEAKPLLDVVSVMAENSIDYLVALDQIMLLLHHLSLAFLVPEVLHEKPIDEAFFQEAKQILTAQDIQLFYQIGLISKRDLPYAPDPRTGFEMALLRMLAFKPEVVESESQLKKGHVSSGRENQVVPQGTAGGSDDDRNRLTPTVTPTVKPKPDQGQKSTSPRGRQKAHPASSESATPKATAPVKPIAEVVEDTLAHRWLEILNKCQLSGMVRQLSVHVSPVDLSGNVWKFNLDTGHQVLFNKARIVALAKALSISEGTSIELLIEVATVQRATPAMIEARQISARQRQAEDAVASDQDINELLETFDASIVPGSIKPVSP